MKFNGFYEPISNRLQELYNEDRIDFSTYRELCDFIYDLLVDFYSYFLGNEVKK